MTSLTLSHKFKLELSLKPEINVDENSDYAYTRDANISTCNVIR